MMKAKKKKATAKAKRSYIKKEYDEPVKCNDHNLRAISCLHFIIILLLCILVAMFIYFQILPNYEPKAEPVYEIKYVRINNTNGFVYNVVEYFCVGDVGDSDHISYDGSVFYSNWDRDNMNHKNPRYGECVFKVEVKG